MDVNTIPGWSRWAIPPLLAPLACMAWIGIHWNRIPPSFASHFNGSGQADGWTTRTPLHLFGFPIFAEGLILLLLTILAANWYGSRQAQKDRSFARIFLAMSYLLATVFSLIGLTPVIHLPVWLMAVFVPMGALAIIAFVVRSLQGELENPPDVEPEDPSSPPLFVPKELGVGYTLNMAHPWAWRLLSAAIGWLVLLIGFLWWSMR